MSETAIHLFIKNFFKISILAILLSLFIYIMSPFILFIGLGGILAMALSPFVDFFIRRGFSRNMSLIIFSLLLSLIGFVPVIGFFVRGSRVITEKLQQSNFSELKIQFASFNEKFINKFSILYGLDATYIEKKFDKVLSYSFSSLTKIFNTFIAELPILLIMGLITMLSIYFFLKEAEKIRLFFNRYFYFSLENGDKFISMVKSCCREVFFSNIITGVLQATIVSTGALIFDVGDFFLVFYATFIASFIPVIGAAPIAVLLGLICFMDSHVGAGLGMLVVAIFSGISDNIIRPYLGSLGAVEVHPFIGFMAVIGGVIMFGLPGLFIGPLLASLIFGVIPIIISEYSRFDYKN